MKRHDNISTSFYMNDGSLYARIGETALKDIWTGQYERMTYGGGTVDDMIALCRLMARGSTLDNHATYGNYRIFPVLLTDDSGQDTGFNYKVLNNWGSTMGVRGGTSEHMTLYNGSTQDFLNAQDVQEVVDGTTVNVPKGYYLSPFIRVEYVVRRIFGHFGYTLSTDFFNEEPFRSMVVVNNVIDAIINGHVLNRDLVPDISCKEFLAIIRKKFCCEFASDERTRTVSIVFMKDLADSAPVTDLTGMLTEQPTQSFLTQKQYRRVVLKPKYEIDNDTETEAYDTLAELLHGHPTADYNAVYDVFYKTGYKANSTYTTAIGTIKGYNAGGDEQEEEIETGDCQPLLRQLAWRTESYGWTYGLTMLYIGAYKTLHSKLTGSDGDMVDTSDVALQPMLAFALHTPLGSAGTISSYTWYDQWPSGQTGDVNINGRWQYTQLPVATRHLWDYSLFYWGEDGIYERFYRQADLLYRNALEEIKVKLLLSQHQKADLQACAVYTLQGVRCMVDKLKFSVGSRPDVQESTLLTLSLKEPLSEAGTLEELLPIRQDTGYQWQAHTETNAPESATHDFVAALAYTFPPQPSAEHAGIRYGLQTLEGKGAAVGWYYRFWLECVPVTG